MNVVVTGSGAFVEVQGTAERAPVRPRRARRAARPRRSAGTARLTRAPERGARPARMTVRLVLATHNAHKLVELRAILLPAVPGLAPDEVVDVGGRRGARTSSRPA